MAFPQKDGTTSQEFVVLGFENGSVHVYDYSKWKG
jgi:hypothetical protein